MTKNHLSFDSAVVMSSTMPSAKTSCSGSPDMFWNGKTAIDGLSGSGNGARVVAVGTLSDPTRNTRIGRAIFFESLLAQIRKADVEPACRIFLNSSGYANPARLGERFEPRSDIDPVAEDVAVL